MDFIFPRHNGHPAWPYYAETLDQAAIVDLFWRKVQTDSNLVSEVAKIINPGTTWFGNELVITPNLRVSLWPESCGAYVREGSNGLCYLNGNRNDDERIIEGVLNPDMGGYYLGPLVAKSKGWLPNNVVRNLLKALSLEITPSDRFSFNAKANHAQVFMGQVDSDKFKEAMAHAFPAKFNATNGNWYLYMTEDGTINFGIGYFYDNNGKLIYKLPISAWENKSSWRNKIIYDTLNISGMYPLYELNKLLKYGTSRYAIVCDSEEVVDYISYNHGWVLRDYPITTYCSISNTDWSKLQGMTPVIFSDASVRGCHEAFRIYEVLEGQGFVPQLIMRQKGAVKGSSKFNQDLGRLMLPNFGCSLPEFAEHCLREFGVQPPDGILPKAVSLASLREADVAPERLIEGLLDTGELMLIHAWRGTGKSLFAMLLGICFASRNSTLNGCVCPAHKYRVLLLDGELSEESLKERGRRLCRGHEITADALGEVRLRSPVVEKKYWNLETEKGRNECKPDLMWADIIIVDSVFKFFPSSMSSEYTAVKELIDFLDWCRKHKKTLILIDHEGKKGTTPFGTMGKEIALDVVLRLSKGKSGCSIKAEVTKARNHAEPAGAYLEMRFDAREKDERITFQVLNGPKAKTAHGGESSRLDGGVEISEPAATHPTRLEEAIVQFVDENPDVSQGEMAAALVEKGIYGGRSTIQARIKAMSEAGKLRGWRNPPKSHKVAEPPASAGSEN